MTLQSRLHRHDAVIAEHEHGDDMPQAILQEWPDLAYPPLRSALDCECGAELTYGADCAVCGRQWGQAAFGVDERVASLLSRGEWFGPWIAHPCNAVSQPTCYAFDITNYWQCRGQDSVWAAHAYLSEDTGLVHINTHGIAPAAVEERFRSIGLRWNAAWSWWEMRLTAECVGRLKGALEFAGAGASNGLLVRMEILV